MSLPAVTFTLLPVSHRDKRKISLTPRQEGTKFMGLTYIKATVINPADPSKRLKVEFLVDSGAMYSVVPKTILKKLGIKSRETKTFTLADGTDITRKVGNALFALGHSERASPIIFGEKGDTPLLGMVSLEALGYILDPLRRELRPLPMVLG
jgi:clan AA aspartic protease